MVRLAQALNVKALLLVALFSLTYFVLITAAFRWLTVGQRAATMLRLWVLSLLLLVLAYMVTPQDLWILRTDLTDAPIVGLIFAALVYAAAFFGGVLQLYNLAERGFSLRILIDIAESSTGSMTFEDILYNYSRGRGLAWMYQKRLDGLSEQGLIEITGGCARNTARGARTAAIAERVRTFLRLESWT